MAVTYRRIAEFTLIVGVLIGITLAKEDNVDVLVGNEAVLQCSMSSNCGPLHSVRWYRGEQRIALVAESAQLSRAEGPMANRIQLSLSVLTELRINPVKIDDDDSYRCELTYITPADHCDPVTSVTLRTLMKPSSIVIVDQANNKVKQDSALGGLLENSEINIECRAIGGKPTPKLTWTVADDEIAGDQSVSGDGEDAVTTNRLFMEVERQYQGRRLKCSASSEALKQPMVIDIQMDLILLPKDIDISGVEHHVVQGSKVTLECKTTGSRPSAVVSWYNGTHAVPSEQALTTTDPQSDGTFTTLSRLSFWASRWENGQSFTCEARQLAAPIEQDGVVLNATHLMDVHFPPVVTVRPDTITVNETSDVLLFCEFEANPAKLLSVKWLQDEEAVDISKYPDHYEGGTVEQPALLIKNSSGDDTGNYFCHLENSVGSGTSDLSIFVDIHFKPEVQLISDADDFVIESDKQNVTLDCSVIKGNPENLKSVKWFLDGELLQQLPLCNDTDGYEGDDMCSGVEPTKLLLEAVARTFHGNYSCQGENDAGWGPVSNDTELIIYYVPGPAKLVYYPQHVIKGMSVKLVCSVDDVGRPQTVSYQWYRGTELMTEMTTSEWTIDPVGLESETNFTCRAVNEAGLGDPAIEHIEVFAPPAFITSMNSTTGIVFNSSEVFLECSVECSPLCVVSWFKNGWPINTTGSSKDLYTIVSLPVPSDSRHNYFESTYSKLMFNMINWPDGILDRLSEKTNYTCLAEDNGVGPHIESTSYFVVEYPPENMTVSNKVVSVNEDHVPEKVLCSAKGKPEPSYAWVRYNTTKQKQSDDGSKKSDSGSSNNNSTVQITREVLSNGYALVLKRGVKRTESGDLVCEATNKHGTVSISTYLNVMYKPSCEITQAEVSGEKVLLCTANSNPTEVSFEWSLKNENDTIDEAAITNRESQSELKLEMLSSIDGSRIVVCVVNNSVGMSEPCVLTIQGYLPWWRFWSRTALIVTVGICILLLLVLLLCCIIMCICRRRRKAKYGSAIPEDGMCISPQIESSIVQAIVSQSIPGLSPNVCMPTTPIQYSEKTRLVPIQGQLIIPQGKNVNPLAININSGRLQADLSQLEASYQAGLQAKQIAKSNLSLNASINVYSDGKQNQSNISYASLARDTVRIANETTVDDTILNNNNDVSTNDNEASRNITLADSSALSNKSPIVASGNKWPLKPGVLVHVNSNHSLSPKRLGRLANRQGTVAADSNHNEEDRSNTIDTIESERNMSNLGILERDDIVRDPATDEGNENRNPNQNVKFDKDRCKNLMRSKKKKRSKFTKFFKRFDVLRMSKGVMSDEDECLSDSDGARDGSQRAKRTKSNKRALSLVGFSLKDGSVNKEKPRSRLRSCLEGSPVVVVPTEGVVSFRRPPKNAEDSENKISPANVIAIPNTIKYNNNQSKSLNDSNLSRSSTNSRKRKKPGESPMNGAGNPEDTGIENPGMYENLPFHGLQQVPNKPIQIIRPRVVRALIGQTSPKTPESVLEKQLECNPSFVPRVLTCPPFSHNPPHISLTSLAKSNSSSVNTLVPSVSLQTLTQSLQDQKSQMEAIKMHSLQIFEQRNAIAAAFSSNLNEIGREDESGDDSDQKFNSLNLKKGNRHIPQFSSMKMNRKRKLDKFYPYSAPKVDYILVKKNDKIFKQNVGGKTEVIYANFSGLNSSSIATPEMLARENSLIVESMNMSYQNLTDSIQIFENSPANIKKRDKHSNTDSKTPTPAPRSIKSPVRHMDTPTRKSPRDHVYANMASQIGLLTEGSLGIPIHNHVNNSQRVKVHKSGSIKSDKVMISDRSPSGFVPMGISSKMLSRSIDRNHERLVADDTNSTKPHLQFTSLTFPKRTSKSGLLIDEEPEEKTDNKIPQVKENKIKSNKTPTRNYSFNGTVTNDKSTERIDKTLLAENSNSAEFVKKKSEKISPSVVDATPKIKPCMVNQQGYNTFLSGHTPYKFETNTNSDSSLKHNNKSIKKMNLKFGSNTEKIFESIDKSVEEKASKNVKKILEADYRANFLAASKVFENKLNNQNAPKTVGKVIPKQNMIILPDKTPLQIPKLLPKPIPKINPIPQRTAVRRSQSSISSKGVHYRQQLREMANVNDGSLIRAKIRELNLRQNTNTLGFQPVSNQTLNQTHPSITKPARLPLQKHHSFCYFQPIKSGKENEKEFTILDKDDDSSEETVGPLIFKPHIKKTFTDEYFDESTNNMTNHKLETSRSTKPVNNRVNTNIFRNDSLINVEESRFKDTNEIRLEQQESLNRLHELLKRDSERHKANVQKANAATYKVGSMKHHKYVPPSEMKNSSTFQAKRLVYADLDLEIPKDSVTNIMSTNKLTSSEQNETNFRNVQRTPYATLKFDDVTV